MPFARSILTSALAGAAVLACQNDTTAPNPDRNGPAYVAGSPAVVANGGYHFTVPADFNGGIFGIAIDNEVSFTAGRAADGSVTGRFRYVQSAGGEDFIFSGRVTCLEVYDTPVITWFEDVPPMTANRAKWGGQVEKSNDPTLPAGVFIWFQSIDNNRDPKTAHPDGSTLSGFGDEAANEEFCASPAVPNAQFGPHPVASGNIVVH